MLPAVLNWAWIFGFHCFVAHTQSCSFRLQMRVPWFYLFSRTLPFPCLNPGFLMWKGNLLPAPWDSSLPPVCWSLWVIPPGAGSQETQLAQTNWANVLWFLAWANLDLCWRIFFFFSSWLFGFLAGGKVSAVMWSCCMLLLWAVRSPLIRKWGILPKNPTNPCLP